MEQMTTEHKAADYLARQGLRCVDMLELLRRDGDALRYAGPAGVLLWDKESGGWFLSARSEEDLNRALSLIPGEARLATCHEDWYLDAVEKRLGLKGRTFFQSVWTKPHPPELPPFQGALRRLGQEWAETVAAAYGRTFGDIDYIRGAIDRGMLGLFDGEKLAGFIGVHDEGSLGMLEVLPPYRRRGYGLVLLLAAVGMAVGEGRYAYGQVAEHNAASLALQQKAGMTICPEKIYWLME